MAFFINNKNSKHNASIMKIKTLYILVTFLITAFNINVANAQASASLIAHASAEVIESLAANEIAQLNFGRFSPGATGGDIKLTPDGVRIATGTITLNTGTFNSAKFNLSGHPEASVNIALPSTTVLLVNSKTGKTMEVTFWESNPTAGIGTFVLTKGFATIHIGATLKVGNINENPIGIYTGTYSITFSYN